MVNPITTKGALAALLFSSCVALAQGVPSSAATASLQSPITLPVVFTKTISANGSHAGDAVIAKTSQSILLSNGAVIRKGAEVKGHIVAANGFAYDKTPYAHQKASTLSIHFDSIQVDGQAIPLNVSVRAMADPVTSREARQPLASDIDPTGTVTQIGGDQLTPFEAEVVDRDGDVVAYNKRGGVYAHLIANGHCDASNTEVSVGIYSASACGLYGFAGLTAAEFGSEAVPSTLTLASSHGSPKVWNGSTALLEVLPGQQTLASR